MLAIPRIFIALVNETINSHQSEDERILQFILPSAENIRIKLNEDCNENDLRILLREEVNERRMELLKRRISEYLFLHRDRFVMFGRSFGCLSIQSKFRQICHQIVTSRWFGWFIDTMIVLNAFIFGVINMDYVRSTNFDQFNVLLAFDIVFVVIFVSEMTMRIVAFGFLVGQQSLCSICSSENKRSWNKLIDKSHKQNWRTRCLNVWKILCGNDARNFNAKIYTGDIGVFEIAKSHDGFVIVWLIIPSCAVEVRILFEDNQWISVYFCRQHGTDNDRNEQNDDSYLQIDKLDEKEAVEIEATSTEHELDLFRLQKPKEWSGRSDSKFKSKRRFKPKFRR